MAKLYIVPTPIGNLDDITLRAIRVLGEADLILAEDTRTASVLLRHLGIERPLRSHHKFNEHATVQAVAETIAAGRSVALVSDAGTPGISDPGFLLVRTCLENGIEVETLPGATAFVPALVQSGLPCDRFCFEGFLPQKKGRSKHLASLADEERTMVALPRGEVPRTVGRSLRRGTPRGRVARADQEIRTDRARFDRRSARPFPDDGTQGRIRDRRGGQTQIQTRAGRRSVRPRGI